MSDTVSYVYAVGRGVDAAVVSGLTGVAGGGVRLVAAEGLTAVVSDVDREEFEARGLEEKLDDLEWLAVTARAHHHVVDAVGHANLLAPLALATVYYSDDRVRAILAGGHVAFGRLLDRLAGRAEWGVKAYVRRDAPNPGSGTAGAEGKRSGAEYLRARRRALREDDQTVEVAQRHAEEVHSTLADLAVESRLHRPQDAALTGRPELMVLNGAYLVDAAAGDDLTAAVAAAGEHPELQVELTGPWVPYSFTRMDEQE